jgi:hypothetical protein
MPPRRPVAAGIISRNRPAALSEAVSSLSRAANDWLGRGPLTVVDGSDTEFASANRSRLESGQTVPIRYVDAQEKLRFIEGLWHSGIPREVTDFALFGSPGAGINTGANRNALLLASAGERLFSIDDDVRCTLRKPPTRGEVQMPGDRSDPRLIRLYPTFNEALGSTEPSASPLFSEHDRILGRTASADGVLRTDGSDGSSCAAVIILTMPGLVGDSGVTYASRLLWFEPQSLRSLAVDDTRYREIRLTRWTTRLASQTVIAASPFCMTTSVGIANDLLLPPFAPNGRSSDVLFGTMIRLCYPQSVSAFLPTAVIHKPAEPRTMRDELAKPLEQRTTHALSLSIREAAQGRRFQDCKEALRHIGVALARIGSERKERLLDFLRTHHYGQCMKQSAYLQNAVIRLGDHAPSLASDLDKYSQDLRRGAGTPEAAVPADLTSEQDWLARLESFHGYCRSFGHLLIHWPDIVDTSMRLRDSGTGLGALLK